MVLGVSFFHCHAFDFSFLITDLFSERFSGSNARENDRMGWWAMGCLSCVWMCCTTMLVCFGFGSWDVGVNVDRSDYYLCVCVNRKDMRIENWLYLLLLVARIILRVCVINHAILYFSSRRV